MNRSDQEMFAEALAREIQSNTDFRTKFEQDPPGAVRDFRVPTVSVPDTLVYRVVVFSLGLSVIISLGGAIAIYLSNGAANEVPDILVAVASTAIGALAGMVIPTPRS